MTCLEGATAQAAALARAIADGRVIGPLTRSPYPIDAARPAILNYQGRYFQAETHEHALADAQQWFARRNDPLHNARAAESAD